MRRSQARASSSPPPSATPSIAASTVAGWDSIASNTSWSGLAISPIAASSNSLLPAGGRARRS